MGSRTARAPTPATRSRVARRAARIRALYECLRGAGRNTAHTGRDRSVSTAGARRLELSRASRTLRCERL